MYIIIVFILISLFLGFISYNKPDIEYDKGLQIIRDRSTGEIIKL